MAPRRGPTKAGARFAKTSRAGTQPGARGAEAGRSEPARPGAVEAERVLAHVRGLHATHLLAFGQEAGAFQQLATGGLHGLNADELAERTGWSTQYTRWFLEALFALGVVDLASEAGVTPRSRYRLAAALGEVLTDEESAYYVGEYPRLHALTAHEYARFPDLFRSGKAFPYALHGEAFLRSSAAATRSLPARFLADFLPRLPELRRRLEAGAHVLDVGCGAGWTLVRLAEEFPKCRILGIDAEPNAIEMAKTLIVFRQLAARAEARLVRGEEIDYEAEFDLATFFLVVHTIPPARRAAALAHAHRALKRDGLLLVVEEAYPETAEEFQRPERQLTVLSQWFEGTWGHVYGTPSDHRQLLEDSGFTLLQELQDGRYYVAVAQRA